MTTWAIALIGLLAVAAIAVVLLVLRLQPPFDHNHYD